MDDKEGKSDDSSIQIRQIFAEFLTGVTKLEQLAVAGEKFLSSFQHGLELLRRPPLNETTELVKRIIKANENERLRSYIGAGWAKTHDKLRHMCVMNTSFEGLQHHISKAKEIMCELEGLMDNAGSAWQALRKSSSDVSECEEENGSTSSVGTDATECASFMAVIYGMVKQDYVMQERIVSALNLTTSTEELDSYCLMWSLRPCVEDDIISQALRYIS